MMHPKSKAEMEKAALLQEKAIDGDVEAIFELGLMYWEGRGVKKDINKAYKLISEAKSKGHPVADFYEESVKAYM